MPGRVHRQPGLQRRDDPARCGLVSVRRVFRGLGLQLGDVLRHLFARVPRPRLQWLVRELHVILGLPVNGPLAVRGTKLDRRARSCRSAKGVLMAQATQDRNQLVGAAVRPAEMIVFGAANGTPIQGIVPMGRAAIVTSTGLPFRVRRYPVGCRREGQCRSSR
jgi:hypothetical protein